MAITIEKQSEDRTGAFGRNVIVASTDDGNLKRFKYELERNDVVVSAQYAPIFAYQGEVTLGDPRGIFQVSGLYSSLLGSYNNPIKDVSGNFTQIDAFNHQKTIKDRIIEDKDGGAEWTRNRVVFKAVDVKFRDEWSLDGDIETLHYTPFLLNKNNRAIREAFSGQYIPFSYYTDYDNTGKYIQIVNADGTSNIGLSNIPQKFRVATFRVDTNHSYNEIKISDSNTVLELIVDFTEYDRPKSLYFLNKNGGWEWYNFIDYEATQRVDKNQLTKYINHEGDEEIQQQINNSEIELKLYGKQVNYESIFYLKDLLTSPIVLDENGDRVRVLNNNFQYVGEGLVEPELTIRYLKEDVINY